MMGKTFGATWISQRGPMINAEGFATEDFIEWSLGTSHLTDENWTYGFERIVQKMRADIAHNRDPFPPSTPAIFCAMCFPPEEDPRYAAKAAGAASQSYKRHPNLVARDEQAKRIESNPGYDSDKKKARNDAMAEIRNML